METKNLIISISFIVLLWVYPVLLKKEEWLKEISGVAFLIGVFAIGVLWS